MKPRSERWFFFKPALATALLGLSVISGTNATAEPPQTSNAEEEVAPESTTRWWDQMIPPTSASGDSASVALHGFGGWAYGLTDGNPYLGGTDDGAWDIIEGGLVVSAHAFERLTIFTQISVDTTNPDSVVGLERAFVEWTFSDWFRMRGGRSPHPIGIYSETLDIGTTRPFFDLPSGVYGPTGVTAESYDGLGLTGAFLLRDWELLYDVYGGATNTDVSTPYASALTGEIPTPGSVFSVTDSDVVGGRVQIKPPIDGFTVGGSAYRSMLKADGVAILVDSARIVAGTQIEFMRDGYAIRGEFYTHQVADFGLKTDHAYAMATVRPFVLFPVGDVTSLVSRLEFGGLWTWAHVREFAIPAPSQIEKHQEFAATINFWFTPTFVARAEYHHVTGNLFAHDGATLAAQLADGSLDDTTNLVKFGLQFSF